MRLKIITISLRQNTTIIGKIEKNKKNFKVDDIVTYKPLLPFVIENQPTGLEEQIKYIAENMNGKDAVFYVTLPTSTYRQDYLLSSVRSAGQDRMIAWLDNNFQKDCKMNYAIGITMVQRHEKNIYVTAAATKKEYIDCLQKAFSENDLVAVEAESAAYVRSVGRWDANYFIVDVDGQTTNVIAYCSKIGMYTTTIPIGAKVLDLENEEKANDLVNEVLLCDATWEFPIDTPRQIYVVGDPQKKILHLLRKKRDLVFEINLPYFKNTDAFPNRELLILPVGTAYREYYGGNTAHANTNNELSASIGRSSTRLPNVKEKVKQIFKIDRYRSLFRHRR